MGYLAPLRGAEWVVYAKRPFAGPEQVLDYVGRYSSRDHALIVDYVGADDLGHHREIEVTDFRHDYWTLLRMTREYS